MTQRWMLAPDAAPMVRAWGDECVVHHALSNDTHRLVASAARILGELAGAPANGACASGHTITPESDETVEVLQVLSRLGLIERC